MIDERNIQGLENVGENLRGCALTVGNFDGVHHGHRKLLSKAWTMAGVAGVPMVAVTFDPPPDQIIHRRDHKPQRLCLHRQRVEQLLETGADYVVTIHTDEALLAMEAEEFVEKIIVERFTPMHVVEGPDFVFGRGRSGNVKTLAALGERLGFCVHVVKALEVELDGEPVRVSSSLIRKLVLAGRMEPAAKLLTRPFALIGPVVHGEHLGRTLNYPTANIEAGQQIVPADGVYAGSASLEGCEYAAAISIGSKPTFGNSPRIIEANLLDAEGDFYDREITIRFARRLRDQVKYDTAEVLRAQIHDDVQQVREIFQNE
ncbi:MAG: bifunctional riboflavin kinase/FAD synthetase [Phycisphaerae bacterium]|nr:bifunctional riboflavin kinase/FAD synthetase [Phycisphaerae bacterium]